MRLFGFEITRAEKTLNSVVEGRGGWYPLIDESFAGAWQKNVTVNREAVLANHAVFSCMTLIASDIAKLRLKLVGKSSDGIWAETSNPAFSPVLRKPNDYQTRIQFWEGWVLSKLSRGNTYVLKERDGRNVVTGLHVLDPNRVRPMVADDGSVFYEVRADYLAGIGTETVIIPQSEIIHDRFNCLFHPLVGLSPIYACGLAATQGLSIQNNSANFFGNASKPGGLLIAPGRIDETNASRLKEYWDNNFTGKNAGKIAVLGDGLKYEAMAVNPTDAQLVEQLQWTAEIVCSTFHVPPYKIGLGDMPTYNNIQALNVEYYSQCLQVLIEAIELSLDEGLSTGENLGTEFDLDGLLRMDSVTQIDTLDKAVKGALMKPNEARRKLDLAPVEGGESVYLQQQNYSLAALAKRDAQANPFGTAAPPEPDTPDDEPEGDDMETEAQRALLALTKGLAHV